ncbi:MAG: Zn-ribbon domain-containing OB-fold protein [Solirubrobacteraceae bacterium]
MNEQEQIEYHQGVPVGRCEKCGELTVPRPVFCPRCLSDAIAHEQYDGAGVVYAATAVRRGPKGVELPYGLAFIDLGGKLRVMARYACGDGPMAPDTPVTVAQTAAVGPVPVLTATVVEDRARA